MAKRPYSMKYTARANPRRYLLSGIPPTLWEAVRAKAKREGVAVRTLILSLLEGWLIGKPTSVPTQYEASIARVKGQLAEVNAALDELDKRQGGS